MTPRGMYASRQRVIVSTGDRELSDLRPEEILMIKIDVEGHEEAVLRGLVSTLETSRAPVYCEVLGYDHFRDGTYGRDYFGNLSDEEIERLCHAREQNGRRVAEFFRSHGYELFMIEPGGTLRSVEAIPLSDSRPGKQGERNVFALASGDYSRIEG